MTRMQKFSLIAIIMQVFGIAIGCSTGVYSFGSLIFSVHAMYQIYILAFEKKINSKAEGW